MRLAGGAALVFLLSCLVSAFCFARYFEGGLSQEFCHYSEIGRNLLEGRGYRTAMVHPYTLAVLDRRGIPFEELAPVLDRFPAHAVLSAAAQAIVGSGDAAMAALSIFLLAACAAAVFAAGSLLFTPLEGLLAGLLFALDPSFQRGFVLWGLPDFGFCLAVLPASALACRGPAGRSKRRVTAYWLLAGASAGLAWLFRSNFMLWLPLFLWAAWKSSSSGPSGATPALACFCAGLAAASCPAWLYNLRWYGSLAPPTFAWNLAHHVAQDTYPLLSYREFPAADSLGHAAALARKFLFYLRLHIGDLPTMWQMHLILPAAILGFAGLCGPGRLRRMLEPRGTTARPPCADAPESRAGRLARLSVLMLGVQIPVFSLLRYEALGRHVSGRYFLWFAPVAFLLAARGAVLAGRSIGRPKLLPFSFLAANLALFSCFYASPQGRPAHPERLPVGRWPELRAAAKAAGPNGLVATNLPAQLAWYTGRRAVALPATPGELLALDRRHPVAAVLITRLPLGELVHTPAWLGLLDSPADLEAFRRAAGFRILADLGTSALLAR